MAMCKRQIILAVCLFILSPVYCSTITEWTSYSASTPPQSWSWHRGFFSPGDNKIYIVGHSSNPMVYDIASQQWSWDNRISENQDVSLDGQYGTVVQGVFYFQDYDDSSSVYKFDPITPEWNMRFAPMQGGQGKCFTSNGIDTVYIIQNNLFKKLDVFAITPALEDGPNVPYNAYMSQCAYYNGYIYLFGGGSRNEISKFHIGTNNENFNTETWQILSVTMPINSLDQGEAVLAGDNIIYMGGFRTEPQKIYSFDPENEAAGVIEEASLNSPRQYGAVIFSAFDNRLYVIKSQTEYSNQLTVPEYTVPETLIAYSEDNNIDSNYIQQGQLTQNNIDALKTARGVVIMAWSTSSYPSNKEDWTTYEKAIQFTVPNFNAITAAKESGAHQCTDTNYFIPVAVQCIKGECNMPRIMYTGTNFQTICYGNSYGVVYNMPQNNGQCDWSMDVQQFRAVYVRSDTNSACNGVKDEGNNEYYDAAAKAVGMFAAPPYPPTFLVDVTNPISNGQECEGDCDNDAECSGDLLCWQRDPGDPNPPGCEGIPTPDWDYCYDSNWAQNRVIESAVPCQASEWSTYGECSKACGSGTQTRTRTIDVPAEHGGECPEEAELSQTQSCNSEPCPIYEIGTATTFGSQNSQCDTEFGSTGISIHSKMAFDYAYDLCANQAVNWQSNGGRLCCLGGIYNGATWQWYDGTDGLNNLTPVYPDGLWAAGEGGHTQVSPNACIAVSNNWNKGIHDCNNGDPCYPICFPSLTCPVGSYQIGERNADIAGCGLDLDCNSNSRFDKDSIDECKAYCDSNVNCKSFSFAPRGGEQNYWDQNVCTIYDDNVDDQSFGPNQILCGVTRDCKMSEWQNVGECSTLLCTKKITINTSIIFQQLGVKGILLVSQNNISSYDINNNIEATRWMPFECEVDHNYYYFRYHKYLIYKPI